MHIPVNIFIFILITTRFRSSLILSYNGEINIIINTVRHFVGMPVWGDPGEKEVPHVIVFLCGYLNF